MGVSVQMKISQIGVHQANDLSNIVPEISEVDERDCVRISIESKLKELTPNTKCNIFQVPIQLRKMKSTAYDPHVISIGPFHHGKVELKFMEKYKLQGLMNFLHRMHKKMESLEDTDKNASLEDILKTKSLKDLVAKADISMDEAHNFIEQTHNWIEKARKCCRTPLEDILKTKSLKVLVEEAHNWVEEARKCYEEPLQMTDHEFVQMMLVDGCFLVELFILDYGCEKEFPSINNLFYAVKYFDIYSDLTKLENQIPFFVLQRLFNLISKDDKSTSFIKLTFEFFSEVWGGNYELPCSETMSKISLEHFVDILSFYFDPNMSPDAKKKHDENSEDKNNSLRFRKGRQKDCLPLHCHMQKILPKILPKRFVDSLNFYFDPNMSPNIQEKHEENNTEKNNFLRFLCFFSRRHRQNQREDDNEKSKLIPPSISELCEAGVTLKKAGNAKSMVDIRFKNGVLEIPPLHINNYYETIMRNLIAFEQFHTDKTDLYVTQYLLFMDYLINTKQDVNLLVKAGIVINEIGCSDKEISELFNNHFKFVTFLDSNSYEDISKDLHKYCSRSWNKSKASLKQNYFNTPWTVISLFAAAFLIVLTLLQTIFAATSSF